MPAKLERELKRKAASKALSPEQRKAYVYGTMRKTGWKPPKERKA